MRFLPFALLLAACEQDVFTIPEGEHSSTSIVRLFSDSSLSFDARFDDSAVYETEDEANQADINKLYGFSDCSSHHHTNSARVGWRWYGDALELHAYTYVDGTRESELLGEIDIDATVELGISLSDDSYVFELEGVATAMDRGCTGGVGASYMLWPYFGGDEVAPHDITIVITEH